MAKHRIDITDQLSEYMQDLQDDIVDLMEAVGDDIRSELHDNVVDTTSSLARGVLANGFSQEVIADDDTVKTIIYSDATNYNGDPYWHYVDEGTGIYNPNSRRHGEPWRFKGSDGKWHTTYGQEPHEFVNKSLENLEEKVKSRVLEMIDKGR